MNENLANINDDYIRWVIETRQKLDVAIIRSRRRFRRRNSNYGNFRKI